MKIRIFKPLKFRIGIERYEELTEHGCHPSDDEVCSSYIERLPILKLGDIVEVDDIRYFYAQSGLERHEPIEYKTLEDYMGE